MSVTTIETTITYMSLMNKSKDNLATMVLQYADLNGDLHTRIATLEEALIDQQKWVDMMWVWCEKKNLDLDALKSALQQMDLKLKQALALQPSSLGKLAKAKQKVIEAAIEACEYGWVMGNGNLHKAVKALQSAERELAK